MARRIASAPAALVLIAILAISGCADTGPRSPASKDSTMTPAESHEQVMEIFKTVKATVGGDGWEDEDPGWNICSRGGADAAQFTYGATRKLPLAGSPDEVARNVSAALERRGYADARVQHDSSLTPPRTVIGYPNGYNGGTAPDGFGFQFQTFESYADITIYGACVPGKVPPVGTPLNPSPSAD